MPASHNEDELTQARTVSGGRTVVEYDFTFSSADLVAPHPGWKNTLPTKETWFGGKEYEVPYNTDLNEWRQKMNEKHNKKVYEENPGFEEYKKKSFEDYKKRCLKEHTKKTKDDDEWIGVSSFFTAVILLLFHIKLWSSSTIFIWGGISIILCVLNVISNNIKSKNVNK
jgi:hypothetical protein